MKNARKARPGIAAFKAQKRAIERERMKPPAETDAELYRDRPSRQLRTVNVPQGIKVKGELHNDSRAPWWGDHDD